MPPKPTTAAKPQPAMLDIALGYLSTRSWVRPSDFQKYLLVNYDRYVSDAAITARFRELRSIKCGGFTIHSRPCKKGSAHEYKIERPGVKQ